MYINSIAARTLLLITSFFLSSLLFGQSTTISGKVTDAEGNGLPSVSVTVKGTSNGTTTQKDGTFSLTFMKTGNDVLVFSSIGYAGKEVPVGESNEIAVQLEPLGQSLNNVVVVGYGTQRRKDITGSVVSVNKERLENLPNTNFAQALQGSIPGLAINLNNAGAEGNDNSIIIRGRNSIKASNSPLIVLDGMPYNGSISDINASDIASIEVLKDASAAAIYGSRGSNGVILITTKKGTSGKPEIFYNGMYGVQKISNLPPILSPEQFYDFKQTREPGSVTVTEQEVYDSEQYPDWLDLATQNGMRTQHTLGVRGGSSTSKYYLSGTYLDVKGVAVNDEFKRASIRLNVSVDVTKWLNFGTNTQLSYNDRSGLPAYFDGDYGAFMFNPLTRPYNDDGSLTIYPWPEDVFFANPLSPTLAKNDDKTHKIITNNYMLVKFPFLKGLSYKLNTGIEYTVRDESTYWGRDTKNGLEAAGDLTNSQSKTENVLVENILNYNHRFNRHSIGFTGLYSYQNDVVRSDRIHAQGFPNDVLTYYQANVALLVEPSASYAKESLISQMARFNYGYDDRYLITLTGRRDGFSGFGKNNKFAFFPSVAAAWNLTNEAFMSNVRFLDNLKLRLSYGSNGNQAVGAYQTLAKLSERSYVDGSATAPGYVPTSLANPDLKWETTITANAGIDFSILNGRLSGTIDYYEAKTHDLLLDRKISSVQGITKITQNIGKTSNKGLELGLNSRNIDTKDFTWTSSGNISFNRNKILELYGDQKNDTLNQWFLGQPIDVNFEYVWGGVWQLHDDVSQSPQPNTEPGYAKVVDLNGDGVIDPSGDKTIIGSRQPTFIWGLANTFRYKAFTLYVFMHGVQGTSRRNTFLSDNNVNSGIRHNTGLKNWWTEDNPTNDFYKNDINANKYGVGIFQSDAFMRIKDISLTYDLPAATLKKLSLSKLSVYINLRNMVTVTKWKGLDPELNNQRNTPLQKEYIIGMNVSL